MSLSVIFLLLTILSLNHQLHCADTDTKVEGKVAHGSDLDDWFSRDWRIKGPKTVIKWQDKFNRHRQFFYVTYDPRNDYCEIHRVSTASPNGDTSTCKYKFSSYKTDIQIGSLLVSDTEAYKDVPTLLFSTAETRASYGWGMVPINFTKCLDKNGVLGSPVQLDTNDKDVTSTIQDAPLPEITFFNLTSFVNNRKTICQLNDDRTEVTCTQRDGNNKVIMENAKYHVPSSSKPEWFRVHNTRSGVILFFFGECPNERCDDYNMVRYRSESDDELYDHGGMNLKCSDVESSLTFNVADIPGSKETCVHAVCLESYFRKNSDVKTQSILQYRRQCLSGDFVE